MLIGSVGQQAMAGKLNLKHEQEILINMADILIETFMAESVFLRTRKHPSELKESMLKVYLRGANERIRAYALEAVGSFVKPDLQEGFVSGINKFCNYPLVNVKNMKRAIADQAIAAKGYIS